MKKRAAARRAGFVKKYIVDCVISDFEALYILTADIDNKINIGLEFLGGGKVSNSFDNAYINRKSVFDYVLAVTRNRT